MTCVGSDVDVHGIAVQFHELAPRSGFALAHELGHFRRSRIGFDALAADKGLVNVTGLFGAARRQAADNAVEG